MAVLWPAVFLVLMARLLYASNRNGSGPADGNETRERNDPQEQHWMISGTKWCGPGNIATHLAHLGVNNQTDACCRSHDRCNMTIPALGQRWGLFNGKLYTMSHCDCERAFHDCLKRVGNSAARMTYKIYFKWLRPSCFRVVEQRVCAEYTFNFWRLKWVCEKHEMGEVAKKFTFQTLGFEGNAKTAG